MWTVGALWIYTLEISICSVYTSVHSSTRRPVAGGTCQLFCSGSQGWDQPAAEGKFLGAPTPAEDLHSNRPARAHSINILHIRPPTRTSVSETRHRGVWRPNAAKTDTGTRLL